MSLKTNKRFSPYFIPKKTTFVPLRAFPLLLEEVQNHPALHDLTEHQRAVVVDLLTQPSCMVVTGPAGCGKTECMRVAVRILKDFSVKCEITALTGLAAAQIDGSTLHSFIGAGLCQDQPQHIAFKLQQNKIAVERWTRTQVLLVDESSMMLPHLLRVLDVVGRHLRSNPRPFGGMLVWLFGDWLQLGPVEDNKLQGGKHPQPSLFQCPEWVYFRPHYFYHIIRQQDPRFVELLEHARHGYLSQEDCDLLESKACEPKRRKNLDRLLTLYGRNHDVDQQNMKMLETVAPRDTWREFRANEIIEGDQSDPNVIKQCTNWFKHIRQHCLAKPTLHLAVGAKVMLLRNKHSSKLCNGTIGYITGWDNGHPVVDFANGVKNFRVDVDVWSMKFEQTEARYFQVPLRLAWKLTVHKAQGMTLDEAVLDLNDLTMQGQMYTALSRLRSLDGLTVLRFKPEALRANLEVVKWYRQKQKEDFDRMCELIGPCLPTVLVEIILHYLCW